MKRGEREVGTGLHREINGRKDEAYRSAQLAAAIDISAGLSLNRQIFGLFLISLMLRKKDRNSKDQRADAADEH